MDEERETAAEDQGYRIPRNGRERHRPLFPKSKEPQTSDAYEPLPEGMIRVKFLRGYMAGHEAVLRWDFAEGRIKHGWAVKSDNQRRERQL